MPNKKRKNGRGGARRRRMTRRPGGASGRVGVLGSGGFRFTKTNGILLASGLLSLVLGYWLLSRGDITAAPLLLVLGYAVLLPLAIIR